MRKKALQCLESETPWLFFNLWNYGHTETLLHELNLVFEAAKIRMVAAGRLTEDEAKLAIPPLNFRRNVVKLKGVDTSQFDHYTNEMDEGRRVLFLEVDKDLVPAVDKIMNFVKERELLHPIWGRNVHATKPITDWDAPKGDIERMIGFSQDHTNYMCSMTSGELRGIVHLDAKAKIGEDDNGVYEISFRDVLYKYLKNERGESVVAELHQRAGAMGQLR